MEVPAARREDELEVRIATGQRVGGQSCQLPRGSHVALQERFEAENSTAQALLGKVFGRGGG